MIRILHLSALGTGGLRDILFWSEKDSIIISSRGKSSVRMTTRVRILLLADAEQSDSEMVDTLSASKSRMLG